MELYNEETESLFSYDYITEHEGIYTPISNKYPNIYLITLVHSNTYVTLYTDGKILDPAATTTWNTEQFKKQTATSLELKFHT